LLEQETGLHLSVGFEVEFNLLKAQPGSSGPLSQPLDHSIYCATSSFNGAAEILREMCSQLAELGDVIEQVHPESGPGQFEIATQHQNALDAADALVFRKEVISSVAQSHELVASFLPKLYVDQAGNGCHCHFSLTDAGGQNVLADGERPYSLSTTGEAFAAGVLAHLPALMALTAGNPNSFRRIAPSTWSGAYSCWGVNNREAPLRLVGLPGRPQSINFELKTVDGTANPHLALVGIVAAGLLGIRHKLTLSDPVQVDPGMVTSINDSEGV